MLLQMSLSQPHGDQTPRGWEPLLSTFPHLARKSCVCGYCDLVNHFCKMSVAHCAQCCNLQRQSMLSAAHQSCRTCVLHECQNIGNDRAHLNEPSCQNYALPGLSFLELTCFQSSDLGGGGLGGFGPSVFASLSVHTIQAWRTTPSC